MNEVKDRRSIEFEIEGKPVTQGSKNPVVPTYKDGRPVRRHRRTCPAATDKTLAREGFECKCPVLVNVLEDNEQELDSWREAIAWKAKAARRGQPLLDGLLIGVFEFVQPRPKSHYGTGRNENLLKDSAPSAPGGRPDGIKLARAVEDALSKVAITDDSRIVTHLITKRYCGRLEPSVLRVKLIECRAQTVADLLTLGRAEMPDGVEQFEQLALLDELAAVAA